jgi:16S rRNA (guanine527-N7)-methyltransferase
MPEEDSPESAVLDASSTAGELSPQLVVTARHMFGNQLAIAEHYAAILATTGVARGILGPREAPRVWDRHILNCVAIAELIPRDQKLIDVGSGAGLPGLVLALARPDLYVTLFEPLLRRHIFLQQVIAELALPNVHNVRHRAGAGPADVSAHVVTARAVAPLERLVEWCIPLLRRGGRLLAIKGKGADEELKSVETTLRAHKVSMARVVRSGVGILSSPTVVIELTKS